MEGQSTDRVVRISRPCGLAIRGFRSLAIVATAACATCLSVNSGAHGVGGAQDALGRGDALDHNLSTRGLRNSAVSNSISQRFRLRNRLITGEVTSGRGFRGSVGYTSPNDFRGTTGSDALFNFRADSALSSLSAVQSRSQLSSSYELQRMGALLGLAEYPRTSSAASADQISEPTVIRFAADPARARADRMVAQSSLSQSFDDVIPQVLGSARTYDNRTMVVQTEPVRGVSLRDADDAAMLTGLTALDRARVLEDVQAGRVDMESFRRGVTTIIDAPRLAADDRVDVRIDDARIQELDVTGYKEILEQITERYSGGELADAGQQNLERVQSVYERLLAQLGRRPETADAMTADLDQRRRARDTDQQDATGEQDTETGAELLRPRTDEERLQLQQLVEALRHGTKIDRLSEQDEDRFNELMRQGEQRLADGQYFWAERRFERALRLNPDHPLASAGLVHAQIGAGLMLPAALTLSDLLRTSPEMIDATYAASLFPAEERMEAIVNTLRRRMRFEGDATAYGLVLAYIGHQRGDIDLVSEGLLGIRAQLDEDARQGNAVDAADTLLLDLLERTWLDADDQVGDDAGQQPSDQR